MLATKVFALPSGTTQTLVAVKARLAKQGLTIPRLELIGAHMATNLITNEALENDLVIHLHGSPVLASR